MSFCFLDYFLLFYLFYPNVISSRSSYAPKSKSKSSLKFCCRFLFFFFLEDDIRLKPLFLLKVKSWEIVRKVTFLIFMEEDLHPGRNLGLDHRQKQIFSFSFWTSVLHFDPYQNHPSRRNRLYSFYHPRRHSVSHQAHPFISELFTSI